jgi:hypothetical protein
LAQAPIGATEQSNATLAAGSAPTNVELPPKDTDAGVEARLLLAECRSPAFTRTYTLPDAVLSMQLMDRVLWNRLAEPAKFNAKGAKNLADIARARKQFEGFEKYPDLTGNIEANIRAMIDIANNPKDKRQQVYADHVNAALKVAHGQRIPDPSPGVLAFWRTAGSGKPTPDSETYTTLMNNSFYYTKK